MSHASSPFSFHCMICFDEFDTNVCIPVVLPCGHTYICAPCANRLDKCMECRTSLFTTIPSDSTASSLNLSSHSSLSPTRNSNVSFNRSSMSRLPSQPPMSDTPRRPSTVTKVRIPLPKNVVLLSLMEAMDFASENANALRANDSSTPNTVEDDKPFAESKPPPLIQDLSSSDLPEENEMEKIKLSTSIITGACGTYAVACKQGLVISQEGSGTALDHLHGTQRQTSNPWDNEVDTFLHSISSEDSSPDQDVDRRNRGKKKGNSKVDKNESDTLKINFGDRVQIVSMVDGWAKLARGYGFIKCKNANDLVKVGGPVDKACSLEAIINTLSLQRNRMKSEQAKLERIALVALREFQASLVRDEDLTVISAEAFESPIFKDEPSQIQIGDDKALHSAAVKVVDRINTQTVNVSTETVVPPSDKGVGQISSTAQSNNINSTSHTDYLTSGLISAARRLLTDYGWTSANSTSRSEPQSSSVPMAHSQISAEASRALLAGAESWRRRNGREAARGIDFRTGMSGHLGIQGHHAHPPDYVNNDNYAFPKMSMHSGLTVGPSHKNPRNMIRALNCSDTSATEILSFLSESDLRSDLIPNSAPNRSDTEYHDQLLLSHLNNCVDFRTGFSGHSALQSSNYHAINHGSDDVRPFPKMSMHTGLTVKRGGKS